jgi:superfamily II DNA or RNA helicase
LASKLKGTTLVMFNYSDHGKILYEKIKALVGDSRPVYIIDGAVKKEKREEIRLLAGLEDCIIVASLKTMQAGVNMPAIENIVYAHPTKGKIQYVQTLGRGIRLKKGKTHCNLYDIGDNLTFKRKPNNTFKHFGIRMETLAQEGHEFVTVMIDFN